MTTVNRAASETVVETLAPKVTTTVTHKDGDVKATTRQGSTEQVITVYVAPDAVFSNVPVTTLDMITDLTKKKFSDEIVAVGQITDAQMSAFRLAWLREFVAAAHKQFVKVTGEKVERKQREFYKELRARGIDRDAAIKMSGYNPDLV